MAIIDPALSRKSNIVDPKVANQKIVDPQLQRKPSLGGMAESLYRINAQLGGKFASAYALGLPEAGIIASGNKELIEAIKPRNLPEKAAALVGEVGGTFVGLPQKILAFAGKQALKAAAPQLAKIVSPLKKKIAEGAISVGAGVGAALGAQEGVRQSVSSKPIGEKIKETTFAITNGALFGAVVGGAAPALIHGVFKKPIAMGDDANTPMANAMRDQQSKSAKLKQETDAATGDLKYQLIDDAAYIRNYQESTARMMGVRSPYYKDMPLDKNPTMHLETLMSRPSYVENILEYVGRAVKKSPVIQANEDKFYRWLNLGKVADEAKRMPYPTGHPAKKYQGYTYEQATLEADDVFRGLDAAGKSQYVSVKKSIQDALNGVLDDLVDAGVVGLDDAIAMKRASPNYVPTEIIDHYVTNRMSGGVTNNLKRIRLDVERDETRGFEPVMSSVSKYVHTLTLKAQKNRVNRALIETDFNRPASEKIFRLVDDVKKLRSGETPIDVYIGGKLKTYATEDPGIALSIKNMGAYNNDVITKFVGGLNTISKTMMTSGSLAWVVPNISRDLQTAAMTVPIMAGKNITALPTMPFGLNYVPVWFDGLITNMLGSKVRDAYIKAGGGFSSPFAMIKSLQSLKDISAIKGMGPLDIIIKFGQMSEEASRVGIFKRLVNGGMEATKAVSIAKDATINFNRAGHTMRTMNLWVPYLNATKEGTAVIVRAASKDPRRLALQTGSMYVLPFVATYINNIANYPEVWEDLRGFERENNVPIIYGDAFVVENGKKKYTQVFSIPKVNLAKAVLNPLEDALEWARKNSGNEFEALASTFSPEVWNSPERVVKSLSTPLSMVSDMSPIPFMRGDKLSAMPIGSALTPPIPKAFIEWNQNKNFYTGQFLDAQDELRFSPKNRYTEGKNSYLSIAIGHMFNMSPNRIDNSFKTIFGGGIAPVLYPDRLISAPDKNIILKTFAGSWGGGNEEKLFDILSESATQVGDETAEEKKVLARAFTSFKGLPESDRLGFWRSSFNDNPAMKEKFGQMIVDDSKGLSAFDGQLKRTGYEAKTLFFKKLVTEYGYTEEEARRMIGYALENGLMTQRGLINHYRKQLTDRAK